MLSSVLLFLCAMTPPVLAQQPADAEEPEFTFLEQSERAPFRGTLFNPRATAEILDLPVSLKLEFDVEMEYQLDRQATEYHFRLDAANTKYTALKEEYDLTLAQKNMEIAALQDTINSQSPANKPWWIAGGAAAGAAVTLGIVYAVLSASGDSQ